MTTLLSKQIKNNLVLSCTLLRRTQHIDRPYLVALFLIPGIQPAEPNIYYYCLKYFCRQQISCPHVWHNNDNFVQALRSTGNLQEQGFDFSSHVKLLPKFIQGTVVSHQLFFFQGRHKLNLISQAQHVSSTDLLFVMSPKMFPFYATS